MQAHRLRFRLTQQHSGIAGRSNVELKEYEGRRPPGIAFGLVVALLVVIGITSIMKINNIKSGITSIVEDRYVKVRLGFDVRDGVNDQIKYLRGIVIDTTRPQFNVQRFQQLATPPPAPTRR